MNYLFQGIKSSITGDSLVLVVFLIGVLLFPIASFLIGRSKGAQKNAALFSKAAEIITFVLSIVGIIYFVLIANNNSLLMDKTKVNEAGYDTALGYIVTIIKIAMYTVYLAFGLLLGYGILKVVENPKGSIGLLIALGVFSIIYVIGNTIGGTEADTDTKVFNSLVKSAMTQDKELAEADAITAVKGHWVESGKNLYTAGIFLVLSVVVVVYVEINKLFK